MSDNVNAMRERAIADDEPGLAIFGALVVAQDDAKRLRAALREVERRPRDARKIARAALAVDEDRLRQAVEKTHRSQ